MDSQVTDQVEGTGDADSDGVPNFLDAIHFVIVMIRWTGLAPWELEFPFPGSLTSTPTPGNGSG